VAEPIAAWFDPDLDSGADQEVTPELGKKFVNGARAEPVQCLDITPKS
jgi:hypothetical protein